MRVEISPGPGMIVCQIIQPFEPVLGSSAQELLAFCRGHAHTFFPDGAATEETTRTRPASNFYLALKHIEIDPRA